MESYLSMIFFLEVEKTKRGSVKPKACRDRVNQTADAEAPARHGRRNTLVFCGVEVAERTDGVDARRQLSDNGVRGADWKREEEYMSGVKHLL